MVIKDEHKGPATNPIAPEFTKSFAAIVRLLIGTVSAMYLLVTPRIAPRPTINLLIEGALNPKMKCFLCHHETILPNPLKSVTSSRELKCSWSSANIYMIINFIA